MIPFLYNVANAHYKAYGSNISRFTFVFPNRRAGVFFQHYLSQIAKKPIFSPQILTVADLFQNLTTYQKADRIEMLFMLYDIYIKISKSTETFDEFMYWGEMLLNDFDDVDKYLVDAKQLFRNIYDLKEIESDFDFLTEDQINAIKRFWSNFLPIGTNAKKKDFAEMWEVLYALYSELRTQLKSRGLAYEGMIFREVAEKIKQEEDLNLTFEKIIFVGLNAHSLSEETFLKYLKKKGIADFYWDYSSPLVCDSDNRASLFISKNRMLFPSSLPLEAETKTLEKPVLELVGIPSVVGQAKYVNTILQGLLEKGEIAGPDKSMNTALVLPDENLLLPVLYSIPKEIDSINVTMGYNLHNSSISGLMEHVFELQRNIRKSDGRFYFYYRPVLAILSHRYVANITGTLAQQLQEEILKYNKIIVDVDDLNAHSFLKCIFQPINSWGEVADYLKKILSYLSAALKEEEKEEEEEESIRYLDIEKEFIIEYYKTINKLKETLQHITVEMSTETYVRLLKKLIQGVTVPFRGEPLSGLQIMGVLETRALDFDNLIITSMNEGIFPMKRATSSFIPYNLRQGFGLPTYEHQDSIFAYHFYRMINRAKRIYLLYDTRTDGMQTGEVSRYFNQIKHLYADHFDIKERLAVYKVSSQEGVPIVIEKTPQVMQKLQRFLKGGDSKLSASSLNTYLDCPLQFYFSKVEGLTEEDEVTENIEASTFGTIFHSVMEWLYQPLKGKMITADLLRNISKDEALLTGLITKSFAVNYFKTPERIKPLTGQNYLTGEVIRKYVKQLLAVDAKFTPFIYQNSEIRIEELYKLDSGLEVNLTGFIDRVDEVRGHTRIIDYKTGKGILLYRDMSELFDKDMKNRPKAVMQVFMYAHLYLLQHQKAIVESGIYYLRNLFDSKFDPTVIYKPTTKDSIRIDDFSACKDEFRERFDACLEEIFDTDIPFEQTTTGEACQWCPFTNICQK